MGVLCFGSFAFNSLRVDSDGIEYTTYGVHKTRVPFSEIGLSTVSILAEVDSPVSITIYSRDQESELLTIHLKIFRYEDVKWLLSNKGLKLES